jgi:hypothetical protein
MYIIYEYNLRIHRKRMTVCHPFPEIINNNQFIILNHDNSALIFTMQRNYNFSRWIIPIFCVFDCAHSP